MNSLPTSPAPAAIADVTSVAASATAVTLLAANSRRVSFIVFNDSSAILYVKFGSGATATDYSVKLTAGQMYEPPANAVYIGLITGVWASATGDARLTELSESR